MMIIEEESQNHHTSITQTNITVKQQMKWKRIRVFKMKMGHHRRRSSTMSKVLTKMRSSKKMLGDDESTAGGTSSGESSILPSHEFDDETSFCCGINHHRRRKSSVEETMHELKGAQLDPVMSHFWRSTPLLTIYAILAVTALTRDIHHLRWIVFVLVGQLTRIASSWMSYFGKSSELKDVRKYLKGSLRIPVRQLKKSLSGGFGRRNVERLGLVTVSTAFRVSNWLAVREILRHQMQNVNENHVKEQRDLLSFDGRGEMDAQEEEEN
jgi:hypothetical protein